MAKITLRIEGMHCDSCAKIIEMELKDKVSSISIDVKKGKAEIDFNPSIIKEQEIKLIITKLGYKVKA